MIHRDVKPANLIVGPDGTVKVTDFGIARAIGAASLTDAGQVIGTAHYMSPEQATGNQATAASDIYSLGVIAYEMFAGRRPFEADTPLAISMAHVHAPVPALPADGASRHRRSDPEDARQGPTVRGRRPQPASPSPGADARSQASVARRPRFEMPAASNGDHPCQPPLAQRSRRGATVGTADLSIGGGDPRAAPLLAVPAARSLLLGGADMACSRRVPTATPRAEDRLG